MKPFLDKVKMIHRYRGETSPPRDITIYFFGYEV